MENQGFFKYSDVLSEFNAKHGRAHAKFCAIYEVPENWALRLLNSKEWNRWYSYKRAIKYIERTLLLPGNAWDVKTWKRMLSTFGQTEEKKGKK